MVISDLGVLLNSWLEMRQCMPRWARTWHTRQDLYLALVRSLLKHWDQFWGLHYEENIEVQEWVNEASKGSGESLLRSR